MDPPSNLPHSKIRFSRRAGVQVNHFCPALIGEFKRMPSRQLFPTDEGTWHKAMSSLLAAAYSNLFEYLAYVFTIHPYMTHVMAFAAVGIYWNYAVFTPGDIPTLNKATAKLEPGSQEYINLYLDFTERFSKYQEVGTTRSDELFTFIRDKYLHPLSGDNLDDELDRAHAEELTRQAEEDRKIMEEASSDDLLIQKQQNFIRN